MHGGAKARGCAYSEADSSAAARAYATVHAEASAEAFAKHCNCANADAWSFGNADLFLELWASAYAEASTTACASGARPPGRYPLAGIPCVGPAAPAHPQIVHSTEWRRQAQPHIPQSDFGAVSSLLVLPQVIMPIQRGIMTSW